MQQVLYFMSVVMVFVFVWNIIMSYASNKASNLLIWLSSFVLFMFSLKYFFGG